MFSLGENRLRTPCCAMMKRAEKRPDLNDPRKKCESAAKCKEKELRKCRRGSLAGGESSRGRARGITTVRQKHVIAFESFGRRFLNVLPVPFENSIDSFFFVFSNSVVSPIFHF